jgi:hypothetical protein
MTTLPTTTAVPVTRRAPTMLAAMAAVRLNTITRFSAIVTRAVDQGAKIAGRMRGRMIGLSTRRGLLDG